MDSRPVTLFLGRLRWVASEIWQILRIATAEFFKQFSFEAGASIAYYGVFSLFPLIIFLVVVLGFFADAVVVESEIQRLLNEFLPVSNDDVNRIVHQNVVAVMDRPGSVGLMAGLGLLWAATNVFSVVARHVNQAWHMTAPPLSFWRQRLYALAFIVVFALAIFLSFVLGPTVELISRIDPPFTPGTIEETPFWLTLSNLSRYFVSFMFFFFVYWWIPTTRVRWTDAAWGALVATIAWRWAVLGFKWSVQKGLINYQLVYGSLATLALAVFWVYVSSLILLYGSHLSAAITTRRRIRRGDTMPLNPT